MEPVNHVQEIHILEKQWINVLNVQVIVHGKEIMERKEKVVFVNLDINGVVNKLNVLKKYLIVQMIEELNSKLEYVQDYQEFLLFCDFHFKFLIIAEKFKLIQHYNNNHFLNNMKYLKFLTKIQCVYLNLFKKIVKIKY